MVERNLTVFQCPGNTQPIPQFYVCLMFRILCIYCCWFIIVVGFDPVVITTVTESSSMHDVHSCAEPREKENNLLCRPVSPLWALVIDLKPSYLSYNLTLLFSIYVDCVLRSVPIMIVFLYY